MLLGSGLTIALRDRNHREYSTLMNLGNEKEGYGQRFF